MQTGRLVAVLCLAVIGLAAANLPLVIPYSPSSSDIADAAARPFLTTTPSARNRRACSRKYRDPAGKTIRPPAPSTRCHGKFNSGGDIFSA